MNVAIIGASDKPDRFSYKALKKLVQAGHQVFPVHPKLESIEGHKVFSDLPAVSVPLDTVTLYVGPEISAKLESVLLAAKPHRVIFNPGTENTELAEKLRAAGISTVFDCTLMMLDGGRF